jgi:hypothetical protein
MHAIVDNLALLAETTQVVENSYVAIERCAQAYVARTCNALWYDFFLRHTYYDELERQVDPIVSKRTMIKPRGRFALCEKCPFLLL